MKINTINVLHTVHQFTNVMFAQRVHIQWVVRMVNECLCEARRGWQIIFLALPLCFLPFNVNADVQAIYLRINSPWMKNEWTNEHRETKQNKIIIVVEYIMYISDTGCTHQVDCTGLGHSANFWPNTSQPQAVFIVDVGDGCLAQYPIAQHLGTSLTFLFCFFSLHVFFFSLLAIVKAPLHRRTIRIPAQFIILNVFAYV